MSQENVELVRQAFRAWNAGDLDRLRSLYHPEAIVRAPTGWPEPGPFVGRDAIMQQYRQLRETFDREFFEFLSEFEALGDRVVVRVDWIGMGRGPQSDMEVTIVTTVRDGRVFGLEYFWDHDDALRAVGLR